MSVTVSPSTIATSVKAAVLNFSCHGDEDVAVVADSDAEGAEHLREIGHGLRRGGLVIIGSVAGCGSMPVVAPTAMIFVRGQYDGISHNPREYRAPRTAPLAASSWSTPSSFLPNSPRDDGDADHDPLQ